jgi:heparanase 1
MVVDLTVDSSTAVAQTDRIWSCVNLDWWPPSKCDYGNCPWHSLSMVNIDLKNRNLRNAMLAFDGNVHLRLGGSLGDFVVYDVDGKKNEQYCQYNDFSDPTNSTKIGYELFSGCLHMQRWDELNTFCADVGCQIAFGINGLYGRTLPGPCPADTNCRQPSPNECCTNWKGNWDSSNAEALLRYHKSKNYTTLYAVELGNELVGKKGIESHIGVDDYVQDWKTFIGLIDDVFGPHGTQGRPLSVAFDTTWMSDYYASFLRKVNSLGEPTLVPDIVTHHLYSMGAGVNPLAWSVALNATTLDSVLTLGRQVQAVVTKTSPRSRYWLGEGGGCYNSGSNHVTNAFNSGFWYLDQMGVLALTGHGSFCRQTLAGGYYGLLDSHTLEPNPDYYSLLAWSRFMGRRVLQVSRGQAATSSVLRVYSHCMSPTAPSYQPGGVALVLINLSNTTAAKTLSLYTTERRDLLSLPRDEYFFSSACRSFGEGEAGERALLACKSVLLNGLPLALDADGSIPPLTPQSVKDASPLVVKPLHYGFVTIPKAKAAACMG